jgi:glycosyltransferase involved in cell wall biosynthesis
LVSAGRPKIGFYYPRAMVGNGGVTNSMWAWIDGITGQGARVKVAYDCELVGAPRRDVECVGVRHAQLGQVRIPRALSAMLGDCDVVVLSSTWVVHNLEAARQLRKSCIPYVVVPHGGYHPVRTTLNSARKKQLARGIEGRMLERAAFVHVFFAEEEDHVRVISPRSRVEAIPTGINLSKEDQRWRGGPYLAWYGRYDLAGKGLDLLCDSLLALARQDRPQVRLRGRDSYNTREQVESYVKSVGLSEWVTVGPEIVGVEKAEFLRNAAGFVLPSRSESHPMALSEALAHGVPCLVNKTLPMAAILEASSASVVDVAGTDSFGRAMCELAQGDRGEELSLHATNYVERILAWPVSAKRFLEAVGNRK